MIGTSRGRNIYTLDHERNNSGWLDLLPGWTGDKWAAAERPKEERGEKRRQGELL